MNQRIIQALEAGDPRSLEWIFEAYGYDCIQRLQRYEGCSPEDAEDIFMDALLLFWRNVQQGKVRALSSSRAYVYSICVNEQRRRYRQRQKVYHEQTELKNHLYEQPYELPVAEQQGREEDRSERATRAQEALHRLGERCQRMMTLFYGQQRSLAEITGLLQLKSVQLAKTLRYRCYQRWLKELRNLNARGEEPRE